MVPSQIAYRFWSKVAIVGAGPDDCWLWTSVVTENGYGHFWFNGRYQRPHRLVHEWLIGPLLPTQHVDHVKALGCTSKLCVNPRHLEAVTPQVNTQRDKDSRPRKTICPHGHQKVLTKYVGWRCLECHNISQKRRSRRENPVDE